MDIQTLFGIFIVLPVLGAFLSYSTGKRASIVATAFSAMPLIFAYLWMGNWSQYTFTALGIEMSFELNPLNWFFILMTSLTSFSALLFSISSVKERQNGFAALMLFAVAGANGVLLARDFLSLFIYWEIMSWSIFLLVIRASGESARIYMIFGAISAYFILFGIGIVYHYTGSFLYSAVGGVPAYAWKYLLPIFIIGFGVKMAMMPLHIWAPHAYTSEQSFVAYLSGGLSKLGAYGIFLTFYSFATVGVLAGFGTFRTVTIPGYALALIGAFTAFIGTMLAIFQDDLRKLLAYSSIAQLGYVLVGFGLGTPLAVGGALFHAFNHALFKAVLFLGSAAVIYRTGEYRISELGGIAYRMPFTFMAVLISIFALAGIPITSGFISKWMIYEAAISLKFVIVTPLMLIASVGAFLYSFRILYGVFLGQLHRKHEHIKELPPHMLAAMYILIVPMMVFAVAPGIILDWINSILVYYGMEGLTYTTFSYQSSVGGANMLVFFVAFMAAFMVAMGIFIMKKARTVDQYDNYLGGEVRTDVELHAAHNFYKPLRGVWEPLLKHSIERFYIRVARFFAGGFEEIKKVYTGNPQDYAAYAAMAFIVFFLIGWWLL